MATGDDIRHLTDHLIEIKEGMAQAGARLDGMAKTSEANARAIGEIRAELEEQRPLVMGAKRAAQMTGTVLIGGTIAWVSGVWQDILNYLRPHS